MNPEPTSPENDAIREAAARWTVRRDRGLSATEAIEFELWLAADRRHVAAMQRSASAWTMLDRVPEHIAQRELGQAGRRRLWRWRTGLAALAAAVVLGCSLVWWRASEPSVSHGPALIAEGPRIVTLADGTLVRLNFGSELI